MLVEKEFLIFVIMNGETLSIKNMVCQRCISAVETILAAQDIKAEKVSLGEIILPKPLSPKDKQQLAEKLEKTGFEILDNKEQALVSSIKNLLIDLIHHQDLSDFHQNPSDYLSQKLHKDYNYLSKLFSETETITIEKYIIQLKIEKVKELLVYNELNLNEIAFKMGYSSTAHLSAQFKKVIGFSPSKFRSLKGHHRKKLDKI